MEIDQELFIPLEDREPIEEADDFEMDDEDSDEGDGFDLLSSAGSDKKKAKFTLYLAS